MTYEIGSLPRGSFTVADPNCLDNFDCSFLNFPVRIAVDSTINSTAGITDFYKECYNSNPYWLNGLVESVSKDEESGTATYSVGSYFQYLQNKPIITQQFRGFWLSQVLDTVLRYYSGIPADLIGNLNVSDLQILGPVEGSSLWAEIQELSVAGMSDAYVQVGGQLEIGRWKGPDNKIECTIPCSAIISASPSEYSFPETTMVRVDGASVSKFSCGEQVLTSSESSDSSNQLIPNNNSKCIISGLQVKSIDVDLNNLLGDEQDLLSSEVRFSNMINVRGSASVDNQTIKTRARRQTGFFGPTPTNSKYVVKGRRKRSSEGNKNIPLSFYEYPRGASVGLMRAAHNFFPIPFSSFGLGPYGSPEFVSADKNLDEGGGNASNVSLTDEQVSVTLYYENINPIGVNQESIPNKYVFQKGRLVQLGRRRFAEIKMSQNVWQLNLVYLPCLKLNQVIEFQVPPTEGCEGRNVVAVIQGITINHEVDSDGAASTTLQVTASELKCLNTDVVFTTDLLNKACAGTDSTVLSPWKISEYNFDTNVSVNDCISLFGVGAPGVAFAEYYHLDTVRGELYAINFNFQRFQGNAPLHIDIFGGQGSFSEVLFQDFGFYSGSFVANSNILLIRLSLQNPLSPTFTKICGLQLLQRTLV